MQVYGDQVEMFHVFLTSALEGGEWSASRSGRFTAADRAPLYPLDRRLGGPHSWSRRGDEQENPCPH
jgi:hypothetical protein